MSAFMKYTRLTTLFKLHRNPRLVSSHIRMGKHCSTKQCADSFDRTQRSLPNLLPRQIASSICCYSTNPTTDTAPPESSNSKTWSNVVDVVHVLPKTPASKLFKVLSPMMFTNSSGRGLKLSDYRRAIDAALKEDSITAHDAESLIQIVSSQSVSLSATWKIEILEKLWQHFKDKGVPLSVDLFNSRFSAYERLNALERFSVIDILTEMEECGVSPNDVSYNKFLKIYCVTGEMPSASEVLEHMKAMGLEISIQHFNDLIHGHFVAGDGDTAVGLFQSMEDRGLKVNAFSYGEMLLGFSRIGDDDNIKLLLNDSGVQSIPKHLLQRSIKLLALQNHSEMADQILNRFLENLKTASVRSVYVDFMDAGLPEIAVKIFEHQQHQGHELNMAASASSLSVEKFVHIIQDLHKRNPGMSYPVRNTWANMKYVGKPDRSVDVMTVMKKLGEPVPPAVYGALLDQFKEQKDVTGLCRNLHHILENLRVADFNLVMKLIFRTLMEMGKNAQEVIPLIQEHIPPDMKPHVNTALLMHVVDLNLQMAIKFVDSVDELIVVGDTHTELDRLLMREYLPNHWVDVFKLMIAIEKKQKAFRHDVLTMNVIRGMTRDSMDLMPFVTFCVDNNLKVNVRTNMDHLLTDIPAEMKEKFITQGTMPRVSKPNNDFAYNNDFEFERTKHSPFFNHLKKHIADKNIDEVIRLEKEMKEKEMELNSIYIVFNLMKIHAQETKNPEKALEYLLAIAEMKDNVTPTSLENKKFVLNPTIPVQIAGLFAQDGMVERAITSLNYPVQADANYRYNESSKMALASVILLCESERQLSQLILSLFEKGYMPSPRVAEFVWQCFLQNVADRRDGDELGRAIDFMHDHPSGKNLYIIHRLFKDLIEQSNQTGVSLVGQKVKEHLMQAGSDESDIIVLNMLTTAFIDVGKNDIATSIVETPGFVTHPQYLAWYSDYCAGNGTPHNMETLYDVMKNVTSVDKEQMLFLCMKSYCWNYDHMKEAMAVFNYKYKKENIRPSARTINYLENVRLRREARMAEKSTKTQESMTKSANLGRDSGNSSMSSRI